MANATPARVGHRRQARARNPSATNRRTAGTTRCRSAGGIRRQQLSHRVDQDAERQLAVAGPDHAGQRGVGPDRVLQPAALPEPDHRRVLGAGAPVPLLGHVAGDHQPAGQQVAVGGGQQPLLGRQHRGDRPAEAVRHRPVVLLQPAHPLGRRRVARSAQDQDTEADRLDARGPRSRPATRRTSRCRPASRPAGRRRGPRSRRTRPGPGPRAGPPSRAARSRPARHRPAAARSGRGGAPSCPAAPPCRRARARRRPPPPGGGPRRRRPAHRPGRCTPGAARAPVRGVMTNGGLDTTRSKLRPPTGCSRLPRRRSSERPANGPPLAAALRAALSRVTRRQRAEVSVAVTSAACVASWNACTPQPVPMSSARRTGSRGVQRASVVEAPPTPSTWSGRSGRAVCTGWVRSEASHHSSSSAAYGVSSSSGRTSSSGAGPADSTSPTASAPVVPAFGRARSRAARATGRPSSQSRVRIASGSSTRSIVTCSAGSVSSRPRAACATGPSSSATGPTRKPAARRPGPGPAPPHLLWPSSPGCQAPKSGRSPGFDGQTRTRRPGQASALVRR